MLAQITQAGLIKFAANEFRLPKVKLGSSYGYTPIPQQTALTGTIVWEGSSVGPDAVEASLLRYSVLLDYNVGPFDFGELGLYAEDGTLALVVAWPQLLSKEQLTSQDVGESMRFDLYVNVTDGQYSAWLGLAESSNDFRLSVIDGVEWLPPALGAVPNAYLVSSDSSFMAYTDRKGLWSFDAYTQFGATVDLTKTTSQSIQIKKSDWQSAWDPTWPRKTILQFVDGTNKSVCRYVESATLSVDEQHVNIGITGPLQITPQTGKVQFLVKDAAKESNVVLPVATATKLGGIKLGESLKINFEGVADVDYAKLPVTSVNGRAGGDVTVYADEVEGLHKVGTSGKYEDLSGLPEPLQAASATKLGGVKVSDDFTMANGTLHLKDRPVKSVNGNTPDANGNIAIEVNYGAASGMRGAYSSIVETQKKVGNPSRMTYVVDEAPLDGRAFEYAVSVVESADNENVFMTKLLAVVSKDRLMVTRYGAIGTDREFPCHLEVKQSKLVLSVDASAVKINEDVVVANTAFAATAVGATASNWTVGKAQAGDPLLVLANTGLYAPGSGVLWTAAVMQAGGSRVLAAAYGNGRWVGFTSRGLCTSLDRITWTDVTVPNSIHQHLAVSRTELNGSEMLVFDSDRQLFMFVNPLAGITYESPDGANWTTAMLQLPLTDTVCKTVKYIPRIGLAQVNDGHVQLLQNGRWVTQFTGADAFAYNQVSTTWLYVRNGMLSVNGGSWINLEHVGEWDGEVHVLPALPKDPEPGVLGAFWVMDTSSMSWVYVSIKKVFAATALTVTCLRTTLF